MTDHTDIVERLADAAQNISWMDGRSIDVAFSAMHEAAAEITRLRAEAEALRKDAERYRWLRARPLDDDEIYIAVDSAKYPNRWGLGGDDPNGCDAAIDATKGTT